MSSDIRVLAEVWKLFIKCGFVQLDNATTCVSAATGQFNENQTFYHGANELLCLQAELETASSSKKRAAPRHHHHHSFTMENPGIIFSPEAYRTSSARRLTASEVEKEKVEGGTSRRGRTLIYLL